MHTKSLALACLLTSSLVPLSLAAPGYLRTPDIHGNRVVFSAEGDLWMTSDRGGPSRRLTSHVGAEQAPKISPDGEWIAYFSRDKLMKVPTSGGTPVTLCAADGSNRGATWGTDDMITFVPHFSRPMMRVSGAGGEATRLTTIDAENNERTHRWPHAVPGEDLVLYTVGTIDSPEGYDDARIDAIRPSTGERKTVLERASMARYVPTGHLIFGRQGFLFAVPFDIDKLEMRGQPVPVLENVMGMRNSGVVHADIAANGVLAYITGAPRSRQYELVWYNRDGTTERLPVPIGSYTNPRISPDRKRVALQVAGPSTFDIWTLLFEQETLTRLTFEGDNTNATWSPDGRRIAFGSVRNNALMSVYVKASDGSGLSEEFFSLRDSGAETGQVVPFNFTADEKDLLVVFTDLNGPNLANIRDGDLSIVLATPAIENTPALSPNGKWLAYVSDETGEIQVFVRAYSGTGGKWQVSSAAGGNRPRWSPDGTELFFRSQDTLQVVTVGEDGGSFSTDRARIVFKGLPPVRATYDYDVFDSNRVLFTEEVGNDEGPAGVTVVISWLDELERRVPGP